MRRPTSLLILTLLVAAPALAQTAPTPQPPRGMVNPMMTPPAMAPTPMPTQSTPPAIAHAPGQTAPPAGTPTPGQTPAPPRAETPRAPFLGGSGATSMPAATNIRLDLTITDTFTGNPVKKTVSLIVLTGNSGMIRTTGADGWSVLNVDTMASAYSGGLVSVRMTFEYTPAMKDGAGSAGRPPRLNESITVALSDGKPMIVSQSADPATDRKVTAELTATILK